MIRIVYIVAEYFRETHKKSDNHSIIAVRWAENETRTRDPNLGKVVLYQLSYFRNTNTLKFYDYNLFDCECKGTTFFLSCKFFCKIF